MNTHADKTQENNSRAIANDFSKKQSKEESSRQFEDNRPEVATQRKIHEMANNSLRVRQLNAYQKMASNSGRFKESTHLPERNTDHSVSQAIQKKGNYTGLPGNLKTGIENLSGYSMDDVRVHYNSEKPGQVRARAYAQGTDIHIASGQEKHLPHEAWHVIQQKQGRVQATVQMKGILINDDSLLEKEADVMGHKALQKYAQSENSSDRERIGTPMASSADGGNTRSDLIQCYISGNSVIQRYDDLPEAQLTTWVETNLANDSDLMTSLQWLHSQTQINAKRKKIDYDRENTEAGYKANKNIADTGEDSTLSTLRAAYSVPDLSSSKYTIKSVRRINLTEPEEEEEVSDDNVQDEEILPTGFLVSSPLYAGVENFPTRYLADHDEKVDDYSFILAYNAHGLLSGDRPVEQALDRNELEDFRGIAIGFYWEQKLKKNEDESEVWTNNPEFKSVFLQRANTVGKRKAFVGSLKHTKVLGTFPYGMWRNIALNSSSVSAIMSSTWGKEHAPVFTHVTDPDAETWIDPFSHEHVTETMANQAIEKGSDIVMGSYVYGKGNEDDNDWDKHIKNIAHASSQMDALLRPALHEKLGVNYPAERNLLIKIKNKDDAGNLYQKLVWIAKTTMDLTVDTTNDYDGTTDQNGNTVFGLGDAEGRKLQRAIESIVDNASVIVSSAAVTTEVPGRVKASIATTVYSDNSSDRGTGGMKSLSNVKESLIARSTNEMMVRPAAAHNEGRKLAIDEFRDRPRQLWIAIDQINKRNNRTTQDVVRAIDAQIDIWQKESDRRDPLQLIFTQAAQFLQGNDAFIQEHLQSAKALHATYYSRSISTSNHTREEYIIARDQLSLEIQNIDHAFSDRRAMALQFRTRLDNVKGSTPGKTDLMENLQKHADSYTNHITLTTLRGLLGRIVEKI